jgi:hypothetical protein
VGDTVRSTPVTQVISGRCLGRKRVHCECADNKCLFSSPKDSNRKTFKRLPTKTEWARFQKYARRMRALKRLGTEETVSLEVLSAIQLCTANEPLLPNLKTLFLWGIEGPFIQYVPWFISPRTTSILLAFSGSDLPKATIASVVTTLPTLCPNLQAVSLHPLPRDPTITTAVSGMLLGTDRNALQRFHVDSPLTEEAIEAIYKLPDLCYRSVVIERETPLPSLSLPDLTHLTITCDNEGDWPQLFHGAKLGKLESVTFYPQSNQIGDFLGVFEKAALSSIQTTLKTLNLVARCSWNPNYSSLLSFTQVEYLDIDFSCDGGCSSGVDDDIIINLSRAMPKLKSLKLGGNPCRQFTTGATAKGLVTLARHCPDLLLLRIHFQVASLSVPPASPGMTPNAESTPSGTDCALENLVVGEIPVPEESVLTVTLTLLRIFPRISVIFYRDEEWKKVEDAIHNSKQIFERSGEQCPPLHFEVPSTTPPQEPQLRPVVERGAAQRDGTQLVRISPTQRNLYFLRRSTPATPISYRIL